MKDFEKLYCKLALNELRTAEEYRRSYNFKIYMIIAIIPIVSFLLINAVKVLEVLEDNPALMLILIFVFFIGIFIFSVKYSKKLYSKFSTPEERSISYSDLYKTKIIMPLVENIFPNAIYNYKEALPYEDYKEMGYPEYYDEYRSDDLITGFLDTNNGKVDFKLADVSLIRKNTDNEYSSVFNGMVNIVTMEKELKGYIKITTKKFTNKNRLINLDMSEFDKYFDVETNNRIVAMQILTADVMTTLLETLNIAKCDFEIKIINKKIGIRLFSGPLFTTSLFLIKRIKKQELQTYYSILNFAKKLSIHLYNSMNEIEI